MPLSKVETIKERIVAASQAAVRFLLANQALEGSWADYLPGFSSTGWVSGYVGRALLALCQAGLAGPEVDEPLRRTFGWLLSIQTHDGGWSWNPRVVTDTDSTANCLLFLLAYPETPPAVIEAGLAALLHHQDAEWGGIHTYTEENIATAVARYTPYFPQLSTLFYGGWLSMTHSVSGVTGTAWQAAGWEADRPAVQALRQYLLANQSDEGYWLAYWWRGWLFPTFHCVQALAGWGEWAAVRRAAAWVRRSQNADGGWDDGGLTRSTPFSTALAVGALLEAGGGEDEAVMRGLEWLLAAQEADGRWEVVPNQQVPHVFQTRPWLPCPTGLAPGVFPDVNGNFTAATVLNALAAFYASPPRRGERRENPEVESRKLKVES
ncbi:MAG: prenyltransferase/squalene oxidase repeat-containing protein [Chloroflexota bacterium]